jgi:hypothetical protein
MRPPEMFGVVVRTIGLLLVLSGAWGLLLGTLVVVLGGPNANVVLFSGIPMLLTGLWLLGRGADALVEFAYPDDYPEDV